MLPVITVYAWPEASQPNDASFDVRSHGTSYAGTMTKWDRCMGSTGRAQRPLSLRKNAPIPI